MMTLGSTPLRDPVRLSHIGRTMRAYRYSYAFYFTYAGFTGGGRGRSRTD